MDDGPGDECSGKDEKASQIWRSLNDELAHWNGAGTGRWLEKFDICLTLLYSSKWVAAFFKESQVDYEAYIYI